MGADEMAAEQLEQCLKIDPNNKQALQLQKHKSQPIKAEAAEARSTAKKSGSFEDSQRIISNRPNAESLNNPHNRKSSIALQEMISARNTQNREQVDKILNEADSPNHEEASNIDQLKINVDLQPLELTNEEEQHNSDLRGQRIREKSLPGAKSRELSPVQTTAQQAYGGGEETKHDPTEAWKQWSILECEQRLGDKLEGPRARFRLAELHQSEFNFDIAIEHFEKLAQGPQVFQKEKTLMRLADCCYRANHIEKGLLAIQRLEKEVGANQLYSVPLLKGKLLDQARAFEKSADCFKQALNLFRRDFKA